MIARRPKAELTCLLKLTHRSTSRSRWMLSKIGQPLDQPVIAAVQLTIDSKSCFDIIKRKVEEMVEYELENYR
ncbi:MAG: methionine adenosyltransferase [Candidatus Bathyarchaeia archaeon]